MSRGTDLVPPGRVVGVDVARCVALVGMVAIHVIVVRDADGLTLAHRLAAGRASALFALLAGVSLALMSGRRTPLRGPQRRAVSAGLAGRAVIVAGVGLVLGELGTSIAVILTYYGVLFLLALPFLGLGARALALLASAWIVVVPVLSHLVRPALPGLRGPSPYLGDLDHPLSMLSELLLTGYYPALPWLGYLLAGMAVGRLDLSSRRAAALLVAVGGLLAGAAATVSNAVLSRPDVLRVLADSSLTTTVQLRWELAEGLHGTTPAGGSWWWLLVGSPHSGTPVDLAHTIGTALLTLGLALLVGRVMPRAAAVLAGAGAMTLTLYSLHVVLRSPGLLDADTGATFVWHLVILLSIGAAYRLRGAQGPLEALVARSHRVLAGLARGADARVR